MSDAVSSFLAIEGEERARLHNDHESSRPLSDDYELVGLVGEAEFARAFRQPLDLNRKTKGDGGIDFIVPLGFTLDVKTARKAGHLLVEQGKIAADIYVLAEYLDEGRTATLLGWEYGTVLARAPVKDFGFGVLSHYIAREALRPISELGRRIMRLRTNGSGA